MITTGEMYEWIKIDGESFKVSKETLRVAAEALKRKPLTQEETVAGGVDFILNCPLGDDFETGAAK
jgi:hypothetical protein